MAATNGEHNFVFKGINDTLVEVYFDMVKRERHSLELFYEVWGSHDAAYGAMGSRAEYLGELPDVFTLGRTWSRFGAWTDHSYKVKTYLPTGTEIVFEFNATDIIEFRFSGPYGEMLETNVTCYSQAFEAPINGTYVFGFSVDEPKTAVISFRCRAVVAPKPLTPVDGFGVFYGTVEHMETGLRYWFPPEGRRDINPDRFTRPIHFPVILLSGDDPQAARRMPPLPSRGAENEDDPSPRRGLHEAGQRHALPVERRVPVQPHREDTRIPVRLVD